MSKWFLILLILIILSSTVVIFIRANSKKEIKRIEKGDLFADDFDIIE